MVGCQQDASPRIELSLGGAQIPVELVQSWLHEADSPGFVARQVPLVRYSQDGFKNLALGKCDIACTDRRITTRELPAFGDTKIVGRRVAFYGYALYVHPDNPLDAIFAKHLEMILQQRITDWQELAGNQIPDLKGPIHVYGLSKSTRAGQQLSHMAQIWFANPSWTVLENDRAIVDRVADDPLSLGFAGIGYDEGVRYLGLRMTRTGKPAFPSLEEIESEAYGLAKLIYVYYREPASREVELALDYLFGESGQRAIVETDVWPIDRSRSLVRQSAP